MPGASFTITPNSASCNEDVTFDASGSSGTVSGYLWDFGDGSSGSSMVTTHAYTTPGVYTVLLTVCGYGGNCSTARQTIEIYQPTRGIII